MFGLLRCVVSAAAALAAFSLPLPPEGIKSEDWIKSGFKAK